MFDDNPIFDEFEEEVNRIIESARPSGHKPVKGQMPKPVRISSRGRSRPPVHPDVEFSINKGIQEVNMSLSALDTFRENIRGLAIYPEIKDKIAYLEGAIRTVEDLLITDFISDKLDTEGQKALSKVQKARARVLSNIYNKYNEKI